MGIVTAIKLVFQVCISHFKIFEEENYVCFVEKKNEMNSEGQDKSTETRELLILNVFSSNFQ